MRDLFLECFGGKIPTCGATARDSSQHALKMKKRSKNVTLPRSFYLHLFINVRSAKATQPDGSVATPGPRSAGTSGPRVVRSGRRRRLVVLVAGATVPPVVQQVSFERRVEHVDVQILKRGGPTLVQHLQHVRKLMPLSRMVVLSRMRVVVPRMGMVVRVHLVRMTADAVVGMDARMVATVVLLSRRRQVVLHVLRGNVLLLLG